MSYLVNDLLGYDFDTDEVFIPNKEISREFESVMRVGGWSEVMRILQATLTRDEERVAAGLDLAHMEEASILTYNDENFIDCAIGLAYYSAGKEYKMIRELPAGKI